MGLQKQGRSLLAVKVLKQFRKFFSAFFFFLTDYQAKLTTYRRADNSLTIQMPWKVAVHVMPVPQTRIYLLAATAPGTTPVDFDIAMQSVTLWGCG